jgi:hypothetical protein
LSIHRSKSNPPDVFWNIIFTGPTKTIEGALRQTFSEQKREDEILPFAAVRGLPD